jgi:nucleoside-diphosphate-sugar epimerase
VIAQAVAGQEIVVKDLEPRRDYVYIDDVVHAMLKAVGRREGFAVFNIGSGVSHSVAELIAEVQRTWGTTATVRSTNERRRDEIMDTVADIAAARRELGWEQTWRLARGLADSHRQTT